MVRKGDVLIEADLEVIKAAGYPATTMVILTNPEDFSTVEKAEPGETDGDSPVMKLEKTGIGELAMTALTADLKRLTEAAEEKGGGKRSLPPEDPSYAACWMAE